MSDDPLRSEELPEPVAAPEGTAQVPGEVPGDGSLVNGAADEADVERPAKAPSSSLPEDLPPLPAALEAVLLVTDEPVPAVTLAQVVERPTGEVEEVLTELARGYEEQGRGFELRQVAGGWRLYTRADCAPYVERFVLDGQQARLTQAALETLSVIAYRQPVTRQRVSAVRGVNVDGVVRTLVARGLIAEAGQDEDTGATQYRTTTYLLERLGLQSLDQLPSLAPLLPELDDLTSDSTSI
ncbi:MAG: chromosome segregation and condensation protein ScpB [Frankiales bacterium]|nr:chromosome segregation and condensation protein ScpB [Frankiales bacterium]